MIAFILAFILAVVSTIFLCHRYEGDRRRPSVILAIFVSVSATLISWGGVLISTYGLKVLTFQGWMADAKPGAIEIILPLVAINIAINLFTSAIIVSIYQKKVRSRKSGNRQ